MIEEKLTRRDFIKLASTTSVALTTGSLFRPEPPKDRYGILNDATKCIGCRRCMLACKRRNELPPTVGLVELPLEKSLAKAMGGRSLGLEGTTWTVVNFDAPKRSVDNYFFVPWQCQHCARPACAGVCPVSAIEKKKTGAVVINENKCIGCRYCYEACPFKVPQFDFKKRITRKCHMCYKWFPQAKPACVTACPVFAKDFGKREILLEKAEARADMVGGYVHGIKEAGGTDVLTILPAEPAELIDFPIALRKGVMDPMDKLRISSCGFLGAATLVGTLYYLSQKAREGEKDV